MYLSTLRGVLGLFLVPALLLAVTPLSGRATPLAHDPAASGAEVTGSPSLTRGPYLQRGTSTSVVVRWRTDVGTDSRVWFGSAPGSLTESVSNGASSTQHLITLSDLDPATRYYYAVGTTSTVLAGDDPTYFFETPPEAGTSQPLRVWVLGDSGTADANAAAVRDAYEAYTGARHTNLWLMLGDNAYPIGSDAEYQAAVFDMYPEMLRKSVLWPTFGNHDAISATSSTQSGPYYNIFTLPAAGQAGGEASGTEAYYSFDWANVHFVVLNSQDVSRAPGSAMLTWLEADLAGTTQDWIVAYWHHPPYTKGSHDSDTETEHIQMRENVLPILEDYGVDLTLGGHSHSYERSFLIDGHYQDSSTYDPEDHLLDGGDGRIGGDGYYHKPELGPDPHQGAVHTVAGSSGQVSGGPLDHPVMFVSYNVLGSVVLDIDGDRLDGRFLDQYGVVQDSFTILKGECDDPDGDTVCGSADNCPDVLNEDQLDTDGDDEGDACDTDDDDDTVPDGEDSQPLDPFACRDADTDTCDDCTSGTDAPGNDGGDSDTDGLCDAGDPDDDNDTVPDGQDTQPQNPFACRDADTDTCDDCSSGTDAPASDGTDTDADGLCDAGDPDDDNDLVADGLDSQPLNPFICRDADADTCEDCVSGVSAPANDGTDTDTDGLCNAGDPDDDNDTVPDGQDAQPLDRFLCRDLDADTCDDCSSGVSATANDGTDTDADGLCNAGDPDDDNDTVPDGQDSQSLNRFVCRDTDADTCDDCSSGTDAPASDGTDTDTDGLCNAGDPDDDNDLVSDGQDTQPLNRFACRDTDADTCDDCTSGTAAPANDGTDTDADGLCNAGDPDDDNDLVADAQDSQPLNRFVCRDADADTCEDCVSGVSAPTSDGTDTDADGLCNAGDPDDDNDLVADAQDSQPLNRFLCRDLDADTCDDCTSGVSATANDGTDTDADGLCNAGDPDDDNDLVADGQDSQPLNRFLCRDLDTDTCDDCTSGVSATANDGTDTDADGLCNAGDPDDDNDGVADGQDPAPLDAKVCGDADTDTCDDCSRPDLVLIDETFSTGISGFTYLDDTFRGTSNPFYASGNYSSSEGYAGGGLKVMLGGQNSGEVLGMSGGWRRQFTLTTAREVRVRLRYNLSQSPSYESDERSEALLEVDGVLRGVSGHDYLARIVGDGNGGGTISTGWQLVELSLGVLGTGTHTLETGGYNNKKDSTVETTTVLIDDVRVWAPIFGTFNPASDGLDFDTDGQCDAGDPDDDNDTVLDAQDSQPQNRFACRDLDADVCDDCSSGTDAPASDGTDTDADGLCNTGDPDDDNDTVSDGQDTQPLNRFACRDTDADACDDCTSGTSAPANDGTDTDTDGLCNTGDPDDDNDLVNDGLDTQPLNRFVCRDADADTCEDCVSGVSAPANDGTDTDADGLCNTGDPDDDNDLVNDGLDTQPLNRFVCRDADADTCEDCVSGVSAPANDGTDTDADGLCNTGDPDDDNDTVADGQDAQPLNRFLCRDLDADTCDDCTSGTAAPANDGTDTDTDGQCNAGDSDDDNDTVADGQDTQPLNRFACRDTDADACDDCTSGTDAPASDGTDTDADGLCNTGDPDDDNDTVADGQDTQPLDRFACRDTDADACDDCTSGTSAPASDGTDTDADGLCNTGDPDDDNDLVSDGQDTQPLDRFVCRDADADTCEDCVSGVSAPASDGVDLDGDGLCNAGDPDDDNDAVADGLDCAPLASALSAAPQPLESSLRLSRNGANIELRWSRAIQGHTTNVYRGARGPGASWAYNETCFAAEVPGTLVLDGSSPAPGQIFYYLLGGRNACGDSAIGQPSGGAAHHAAVPCAALGLDSDGDGTLDVADNCPVVANAGLPDTDHDFVGNACDNCPSTSNSDQHNADLDSTGDACDTCTDVDLDGFGNPGYPVNICPTDNCPATANSSQANADGDALGDACDTCALDAQNDADGDGVCGNVDNCPTTPNANQANADGDALGDVCDTCTDSDQDGFGNPGFPFNTCPADNCPFVANSSQSDADGDTLGDACDTCTDVDEDGFGNPGFPFNACPADNCPAVSNPSQDDADGDTLGDACDPCSLDPQNDVDVDGICGDVDNCPAVPNPTQINADGDTLGDACDPCPLDAQNDVDVDGVCGDVDNCPTVPNSTQINADSDTLGDACDPCPLDAQNDADVDGVCGDVDNCPAVPNPPQINADGDTLGDACDPCPLDAQNDADVDGVCGDVDNCPAVPNPTQINADGDALGDACDPCPLDAQNDADQDGICGDVDNCPAVPNPEQTDTDEDGPGDACDECPLDAQNDADEDGICGDVDNCPAVPNPEQTDTDEDGLGDACDP